MNEIKKAVSLLKAGKIVILPTETVYGLACDPTQPDAIKEIYTIKNRPEDKALSILIADTSEMAQWAINIPDLAYNLVKRYWPGPLTLILKKAPHVSDVITAEKNTIGLRIPDHPITLEILRQFGSGLCAPSANFSGQLAPTRYQNIDTNLLKKVALAIDGGPCRIGQASTIIDLTHKEPVILRGRALNIYK